MVRTPTNYLLMILSVAVILFSANLSIINELTYVGSQHTLTFLHEPPIA